MSSEEDEYNFLDSISSTESSELTDSDTSTSDGGDNIISVSDLTDLIKDAIKINFDKGISIIGEISNYKSSKGHIYFTLKDTDSSINTIVWSYMSKKINIKLENGSKVIVTGIINIFNKAGTYNLIAHDIKSVGVGDLHQEYLKLKEHYDKLGYFKDDHKKKLPLKINKVGIITASDGAALQDFLYVLKKNNYNGEIYIKNCLVQGKGCPNNVAKCIELLDEMNLDVIVLARGGGSFEDLFGFSDKKVIETVYNCVTLVISAIGHEVDFMLSDFVADISASTPSNAIEIATPDINELRIYADTLVNDFNQKFKTILYQKEQQLKHIKSSFEQYSLQKRFEFVQATITQLRQQFNSIYSQILKVKKDDIERIKNSFFLNNPEKKDKKGFVQLTKDNKIIDINTLKLKDIISLESSKTVVKCEVIGTQVINT